LAFDVKFLREISVITSTQGYTLKKPLYLRIPEPKNELEAKVFEYIIESFTGYSPYLARTTFENTSALKIAEHLLLHRTGSKRTLNNYIYNTCDFTRWLGTTPDKLLNECLNSDGLPKPIAVAQIVQSLDGFLGYLVSTRKLAPTTIFNKIQYIRLFFRRNGLELKMPYSLTKWSLYEDRAPTREELQTVLGIANLREKVIIGCLATSGLRVGTLAKLQYCHIKKDFERNISPIHIHIEGNITKTKYYDYTYANILMPEN
jgi:hypothetical protein